MKFALKKKKRLKENTSKNESWEKPPELQDGPSCNSQKTHEEAGKHHHQANTLVLTHRCVYIYIFMGLNACQV